MALVDLPQEMILRMFQLQSGSFPDECEVYPAGRKLDQSPFGDDDRVFAVFKGRFAFSSQGVSVIGKNALAWRDIARTSVIWTGRKDVLIVEGTNGQRLRIDLSSPRGRTASRIEQLVAGLAKRWSSGAYTGLAPMDVEAFFAKARRTGDFAVNLYPPAPLAFFHEAFVELTRDESVSDLFVLPRDPEGEGRVYAEEIAIVSEQPSSHFADFLVSVRANEIVAANENNRRRLGLAAGVSAWVIRWL